MLLGALALAGCDSTALAPRKTAVTPQPRPEQAVVQPPAPTPTPALVPSADSTELALYFRRVQADLLVRGLLRTDGGGPDTLFTDTMLAQNFELIALRDEFVGDDWTRRAGDTASPIKKWLDPVRIQPEFGPRVPDAIRSKARAELTSYAARLQRVTGHPISVTTGGGNFHVLFMSEDDRNLIAPRIREILPTVSDRTLSVFDPFSRNIHCVVIAFESVDGSREYGTAVAVIRTEHPDLLRRACIHEEVAQGLGLANDSPYARPSIFNDDDEFALLTTHDEMLLRILYDPRLTPGMSAEAARPIVRARAAELLGGGA